MHRGPTLANVDDFKMFPQVLPFVHCTGLILSLVLNLLLVFNRLRISEPNLFNVFFRSPLAEGLRLFFAPKPNCGRILLCRGRFQRWPGSRQWGNPFCVMSARLNETLFTSCLLVAPTDRRTLVSLDIKPVSFLFLPLPAQNYPLIRSMRKVLLIGGDCQVAAFTAGRTRAGCHGAAVCLPGHCLVFQTREGL